MELFTGKPGLPTSPANDNYFQYEPPEACRINQHIRKLRLILNKQLAPTAHEPFQRVPCQRLSGPTPLPADIAHPTLQRLHSQDRRKTLKVLSLLALGVPLTALTASQLPWGVWQADLRTATEEQSRLTLADGGAAGNAFAGRGTDKRVEIPVPRAASQQDGLWLTVRAPMAAYTSNVLPLNACPPRWRALSRNSHETATAAGRPVERHRRPGPHAGLPL
ncbi:hypothetical protein UMZ34_03555 [Halopseudomonas pachastrellae]|nr:hypothetical protein UMZ34_03555 [Halopseudomonas pachastrellae]